MKPKVLITGGSGFIGANLVRKLIRKNFDLHLILRPRSSTWRINSILSQLTVHTTPLFKKRELTRLMKSLSPQYIFHLAAYGNYSWQPKLNLMTQTNIIDLENLLEASCDVNYKSFINTGSSTEYGFKNKPISESENIDPESFYGATKASGTILCQTFARRFNKPIITFRLFSVYGPYEEGARFIPTIIRSAINGREIYITKELIRRDFIHVDDVVSAYLKAMDKGLTGEVFNIGTGKQYSNQEVLSFIRQINNSIRVSSKPYPERHWDSSSCVANISKSKLHLNWSSGYDIKEGLKLTYDWFKKNENLYV